MTSTKRIAPRRLLLIALALAVLAGLSACGVPPGATGTAPTTSLPCTEANCPFVNCLVTPDVPGCPVEQPAAPVLPPVEPDVQAQVCPPLCG